MRAAERLDERNDLLLIIQEIDGEVASIRAKATTPTLRDAQVLRDSLQYRAEMCKAIRQLGFEAPALDTDVQVRQRERGKVIQFPTRQKGSQCLENPNGA